MAIAMFVAAAGCSGPAPKATTDPAPETESEPAPPAGADRVPAPRAGADPLSGPPDAPGKLPMYEVENYMVDVKSAIKACADATTYEGKVSVRVTITPGGEASAELTTASGEADIDECMVGAFENVTFPESERGQRFSYSYSF